MSNKDRLHDTDTPSNETDEEQRIQSRFGEITIDPAKAVFFPQGLLGLTENLHFALADIPKENMGQFRLLQCLNDESVSFVVLPLNLDNPYIAREDLQECCKVLRIAEKELLTLLIVSVQRSPEGIKITANVRAPVLVDVKDQAGIQYVFPTNKYDICHQL